MARIYQADIYCDACGRDIEARLRAAGKAPEDFLDEGSYDSDDFPKWADDEGEADTPQHCGSGAECLEPTIISGQAYGAFLHNALTPDGERYVIEAHEERPSAVTRFWMGMYDLLCMDSCGRKQGHACKRCGRTVDPYDCDGRGAHDDKEECDA